MLSTCSHAISPWWPYVELLLRAGKKWARCRLVVEQKKKKKKERKKEEEEEQEQEDVDEEEEEEEEEEEAYNTKK
mgnify:CR=1 FL=1